MQKDAKCSYAHPARNPWITGAKDIARADDDVWHTKPLRIFSQDLILLHFYQRIGVSAQLGMPIDGAILIKHSSFRLVPVTVDRKCTDVHNSLQTPVRSTGFHEISRGYNGIHEGVRN